MLPPECAEETSQEIKKKKKILKCSVIEESYKYDMSLTD